MSKSETNHQSPKESNTNQPTGKLIYVNNLINDQKYNLLGIPADALDAVFRAEVNLKAARRQMDMSVTEVNLISEDVKKTKQELTQKIANSYKSFLVAHDKLQEALSQAFATSQTFNIVPKNQDAFKNIQLQSVIDDRKEAKN